MNNIHETAIIYPGVVIGENVYIGAYCIIGAPAENKKTWNDGSKAKVYIGDNAIIHGHVTIDSGTEQTTYIGSDTFIMKGCHIGHDAFIGIGVTMSPHTLIGGFARIGLRTNMGMGSVVHQRVQVPEGCMIGMNTTITKKSILEPHGVYIGSPAKFIRWNKRKKI